MICLVLLWTYKVYVFFAKMLNYRSTTILTLSKLPRNQTNKKQCIFQFIN
ncbi:hypothetical protein T190611E02C_30359 [Tenacibaculum sp. 190524A05c]